MITIYVLETCPYCNNALDLLTKLKIKHKKIVVPNTEEEKNKYKKLHKMNTFPQIFIDKKKLGGYSDLEEITRICKDIKDNSIPIDIINSIYKGIYK